MTAREAYQEKRRPDDVVVDNSIMKEVMRCSLAATLRYGLNLAPRIESAALVQGQAGHAAMAEWFDTEGDLKRALGVYAVNYAAKVPQALATLPANDARSEKERSRLAYERTAKILKHWFRDHPIESWALVVKPGDTELPMSAPLMELKDGRRVLFVALIDALSRRRHGGLYSTDHKFRNGVTDWWIDKQEDSSQFTGQAWLGRAKGLELAGIYVNAVEIHHTKTSPKKCNDHGSVYTQCDAQHARHKLIGPLTKSKHELAAWEATMRKKVPRWVAMKESVATLADVREGVVAGRIPTEGRWNESCVFCGFREWCRQGRPVAGKGDWFVPHTWDPLSERRSHAAEV